ncbi:hypothetical protein AKJ43_03005, partial [candidate division MSBL1 archaeon SCGC-AAA261D19]
MTDVVCAECCGSNLKELSSGAHYCRDCGRLVKTKEKEPEEEEAKERKESEEKPSEKSVSSKAKEEREKGFERERT